MSSDLDLATLEHWFGWMRNSESWRREREIVFSMWDEIERLNTNYELLSDDYKQLQGDNARLRQETLVQSEAIETLRGLLREALRIDAGDFSVSVDEWIKRVSEALGE